MQLARLRLPAHQPTPSRPFFQDLRDGWSEFHSRTWVWITVAYASSANMFLAALLVLGPVVAKDYLGGVAAWAIFTTALGAGFLVGGLIVLHVKSRYPVRTAVAAAAVCVLPTLSLALRLPVAVLAAAAVVAGIGLTIFNALWATAIQQHVPRDKLSRVSAYDSFGSFACQPIGQAVAGPIAAGIGLSPTLWLAGGLQLLLTLATLSVPDVRRVGGTGPTELAPEPGLAQAGEA